MGWTVLYTAFGIVALWLLGEVLLQYKARLRWRLLAFAGFLCVVLGVLMPSVVVIALGAITFAVGQTYVTLSFRRGFSTGWALGGSPGSSRRRRSAPAPEAGARLAVSDLEAVSAPDGNGESAEPGAPGPAEVYQPEPMPNDTAQYGVYRGAAAANGDDALTGYDAYGGGYGQDTPAGHAVPEGQDIYAGQYDYGATPQYAAYSDPYTGSQSYDPYQPYGQQQYSPEQYSPEQYAAGPYPASPAYDPETPPGGFWVPQQREGEQPPAPPPMPEHQPYPYPYPTGYDGGYDGQYRY
jgi:hypothetical protein